MAYNETTHFFNDQPPPYPGTTEQQQERRHGKVFTTNPRSFEPLGIRQPVVRASSPAAKPSSWQLKHFVIFAVLLIIAITSTSLMLSNVSDKKQLSTHLADSMKVLQDCYGNVHQQSQKTIEVQNALDTCTTSKNNITQRLLFKNIEFEKIKQEKDLLETKLSAVNSEFEAKVNVYEQALQENNKTYAAKTLTLLKENIDLMKVMEKLSAANSEFEAKVNVYEQALQENNKTYAAKTLMLLKENIDLMKVMESINNTGNSPLMELINQNKASSLRVESLEKELKDLKELELPSSTVASSPPIQDQSLQELKPTTWESISNFFSAAFSSGPSYQPSSLYLLLLIALLPLV